MNRREISPSLMGSVALHAAVAAALLISWRHPRDLKIGSVVPVTIVSNAPPADLGPAIEAPEPQTAQAEQPAPEISPQPVPPAPQPLAPQPPKPQPAPPKPAPAPTPQKAAPAKPQPPAKAEKSLDLDALAASVSKMAKPSGARGAPRPETAPQARTGQGSAASAAALNGLVEDLQRRWNPNCDVQGGRDVTVRATFQVGSNGQLASEVATQANGPNPPVTAAAAVRAASAVQAAAPFRSLPREYYGQRISVIFNAREACS